MKKFLTMAAFALLTLYGCNNNKSSVEKKESSVEKKEKIETPPHAASTLTWTYGNQVWSDAIQMPACNKSKFKSSNTSPDCHSYVSGTSTWYYYNWSYVEAHKSALCPAPWRVPTEIDLWILGSSTIPNALKNAWGQAGYSDWGYMMSVGVGLYHWSSTKDGAKKAWNLACYDGSVYVRSRSKELGFQVRCVR
jgi:hypothetical protein